MATGDKEVKIWLDDVRAPPASEWVWVGSIDIAKLYIVMADAYDTFEEISLDHDLGQEENKEGIHLLDWMAEYHFWPKKKPVVHSMNTYAAQAMRRLIDRYYEEKGSVSGDEG
jgi:hypothetical protein